MLVGSLALTACDTMSATAPVAEEEVSAEVQAVTTPATPDPTEKAYIQTHVTTSKVKEQFNNELQFTKTVDIAGKTLILDSSTTSPVATISGETNIKRLNIYADKVIVRRRLILPGTEVHIHAQVLSFEDVNNVLSIIDTTPKTATATPAAATPGHPAGTGANGLRGGDIYVYVASFFSQDNRLLRFKASGGAGQKGGIGVVGVDRGALPKFATAHPDLMSCAARGVYMATSSATPIPPPFGVNELRNQAVDFNVHPASGENGTPAGRPGDAGDSGNFITDTNVPSLASFAELRSGTSGPLGATYGGGHPSTPNPAITLQSARCQDIWCRTGSCSVFPPTTNPSHPDPFTVQLRVLMVSGAFTMNLVDGLPAAPPAAVHPTGRVGTITKDAAHNFDWFHPNALAVTIGYAEDAFANGDRATAQSELQHALDTLTAYQASPGWILLSPDDQTLFGQQELQIKSLLNKLRSDEDFYGNPKGWVPALSLEASKAAFEQEVPWAIRAIFVADFLTNASTASRDKAVALGEAKALLRTEIEKLEDEMNAAIENIPDLKVQAANAGVHLEGLKNDLEAKLTELTERAKHNVEDSHKAPLWKRGLHTLAAIAKVIPVPIVAGIGPGLDALLDFNPDDPIASLFRIPDVVSAFQGSDSDAKAKEAKDKKDEAKPETKTTKKSLKDTISSLKKYIEPLTKALKDQKGLFASVQAPKDEIEKELDKLEKSDPEFVTLSQRVKDVLAERERLTKAVTDTLEKVENAATAISEHYLEIAELLPELQSSTEIILTQRAELGLKEMRRQAVQRLRKYQYLLSKAYEYRMLQPYPGDFTLINLFNEMNTLLQAANSTGALTNDQVLALYTPFRNELAQIVSQVIDSYQESTEHQTDVEYDLTPAEIAQLNSSSGFELNFWEKGTVFGPDEEDVRIVDLQVIGMTATTATGAPPTGVVEIVAEHSGLSRIWRSGRVSVFQHYNKQTTSPTFWSTRFQNGHFNHDRVSANAQSLLAALISANVDLTLFARPSAWASLRVRKVLIGADQGVNVSSMRFKLTYDYRRVPGSTYTTYRDGQNTTIQARYAALLHRPASASELIAARELLDLGAEIADVDNFIRRVNGLELQGLTVDGIYSAKYQRAPNAEERAFWSGELLKGRTEAQVGQYIQTITDTVAQRLGRQPTMKELEDFTAQLDAGLPL